VIEMHVKVNNLRWQVSSSSQLYCGVSSTLTVMLHFKPHENVLLETSL